MAAAYGLYTHIQSNKRRSIALLLGLFFLVYVMVYAGALVAEAMRYDASVQWLLRAAWRDLIWALPWATGGTLVWIAIAYLFNQSLIDAVTGGREVTRKEQPRLYNLLENLCISRGIPMPKLKVMEDEALNAFASGLNASQYSISVTTGLLNRLDDPEVEAVLIDRPGQPSWGAGEQTPTTIPAAIANAIFDATGARLRQIPFTPDRVQAALKTAGTALA